MSGLTDDMVRDLKALIQGIRDAAFPMTDDELAGELVAVASKISGPIPMLLFCPNCGLQHVDAPEPATGWTNPPHRSHKCAECKTIWRPSDFETVGVSKIDTVGAGDTWFAVPKEAELYSPSRG